MGTELRIDDPEIYIDEHNLSGMLHSMLLEKEEGKLFSLTAITLDLKALEHEAFIDELLFERVGMLTTLQFRPNDGDRDWLKTKITITGWQPSSALSKRVSVTSASDISTSRAG